MAVYPALFWINIESSLRLSEKTVNFLTNGMVVDIIIISLGLLLFFLYINISSLIMARKKRSTHCRTSREDGSLAERQSGSMGAEGSFGAGRLNDE